MNTKISPALSSQFISALNEANFLGDVSQEDVQLTVYSTDNSVYMRRPQAVIWPKTIQDLQLIMRLAEQAEFQQIILTARGGGTGTNGQSLTNGIVVDLSRYMNQVLDIDPEKRQVRVQAGVVKDQLNAALKPYGLFFAPELSTSDRATIGGMINTDASGQGSCTYGKTCDHVLGLKTVIMGGSVLESETLAETNWQFQISQKPEKQRLIYGDLYQIASKNQALIEASFPKLNRCLTGYDLPHLLADGKFNINSVICGSEGSLGFIAEATLNVLPIAKHRGLINIGYADFMSALDDAKALMTQLPLSIETLDSKVLGLAKEDLVWHQVSQYFPHSIDGINLVEINANSESQLDIKIADFLTHLDSDELVPRISVTVAKGAENIAPIYAMRKRAVGLLGNVQGESRPIPFVEDCAVPPENLPDFIREFRSVLDDMGLSYGMFGHTDAGVLHVRPEFDQKDVELLDKLKVITDKVAALAYQYGGVLWGEHGKGLRSSYSPTFFGDAWPLIQQVKSLFDPRNQLNPGKIATPDTLSNAELTKVNAVNFRGQQDLKISPDDWQRFGNVMHCNGNGSCYNYDFDAAMCPSWKFSRDRAQSPKGRAMLIKEWLARKEDGTLTKTFEKAVYQTLHSCLSCKSCAGECPVKVDIPDAKSQFLSDYHQKYHHTVRDWAIGNLEKLMPSLSHIARFYNAVQKNTLVRAINKNILRICDAPLFSKEAQSLLNKSHAVFLHHFSDLPKVPQKPSVLIVLDAFTRYFETPVLADWLRLLDKLGVRAYVLPYFANGKPLHIHGYLAKFDKLREKNEKLLAKAASTNLPLIGLDPAMTLVFRQEYLKGVNHIPERKVLLPQEYLVDFLKTHAVNKVASGKIYYLALHCTEKTQLPNAGKDWEAIFSAFGITLNIIQTGCCGMAGTYGHESEHQASSKGIYQQSWQAKVQNYQEDLLATGFSCRCQVKRMDGVFLRHPLQVLLEAIGEN